MTTIGVSFHEFLPFPEKQLEDEEALDKNLNKEKAKAFADEDAVDSDEERKKKEEQKKDQPAGEPRKKNKAKDYDELFEKRLGKPSKGDVKPNANLSKEEQSRLAERDITDQLFADMDINANLLNSEKEYVNFGKKVSDVLYQGQAPYRIPSFFKEIVRELPKHCDSKKIKEVFDQL